MKLLVLNGPNLNLLGLREPDLYGKEDYAALCKTIQNECDKRKIICEIKQSNHEGVLVDAIQQAYGNVDGIVINPAAYTHTSVAILDALKAVAIPAVEVHLTDIQQREDFRRISYPAQACLKQICGHGFAGYCEAIAYLQSYLEGEPHENH